MDCGALVDYQTPRAGYSNFPYQLIRSSVQEETVISDVTVQSMVHDWFRLEVCTSVKCFSVVVDI